MDNQTRKMGAAYIRVSTDDQTELSPDAQKRLILNYGEKNNIDIAIEHIFFEHGISGKKADKRPEFQRMIALAKSPGHPFDVILVWKFSRFARNQEESIVYKSMLKKDNVEVCSISEPLIDGPFGSLIERIIEWMDEYYSIRLSGEVMRGMTEKAMRGGYQATTPLGYQYNGPKSVPTIIEQEASIIRNIYALYLSGMDCTSIARKLNTDGYKTKRGNSFEYRVVRYILKNPFYIGKVRWNRAPHSVYRDNAKEEIIIADGRHSPIVLPHIFNQVQKKLAQEQKNITGRSVSTCSHWLTGLLKCPICGANLSFNKSKCDNFQCWKYAKGYHKGSVSISAKKVTAALLSSLSSALGTHTIIYEYLPQELTGKTSASPPPLSELDRLQIKEQRIKDAYENGIDTLEEYRENKFRLKGERERLLQKIKTRQNHPQEVPPSPEDILKHISTVYELISDPEVNYIIKGNAVRSIIKKIIYDREKDVFYFTYYIDTSSF